MRTRAALRVGVALTVALLAGVLTGCTPTADPARPVLVGTLEPTDGIRPGCADTGCAHLAPALLGTLVVRAPDGSLIDDLAESIASAAELQAAAEKAGEPAVPGPKKDPRFRITLREGLAFSSGEPITSSSFVDAWRMLATTTKDPAVAALFAPVRGYTDDPTVDLAASGALEVVDDRTFVVHLAAPMADFPAELTLPAFAPLPSAALADPEAGARAPVSSGPYMLAGPGAWQPGEQLDLVPNPNYLGPRRARNPGLEVHFFRDLDVAFAEFLVGHLDAVDPIPRGSWATASRLLGERLVTGPLPELVALAFPGDLGTYLGEDGALRRRAIELALDRPGLVDPVLAGRAAVASGFLPGSLGLDPVITRGRDQVGARSDWDTAQQLAPAPGSIVVVRFGDEVPTDVAVAVQTMLDDTFTTPVSSAHYADRAAYRDARDAGDPEGIQLVAATATSPAWSSFLQGGGLLLAGALTRSDSAAVAAVSGASSYPESRAALATAETSLAADLPAIPLYVPLAAAAQGERIAGLRLGWNGVPDWAAVRVLG